MAIKISGTTVINDDRALLNHRLKTVPISANTSANNGLYYVATSSLTLTLPTSPSNGDLIGFSNQSNTTTCVLGRNSSNIQGLAEDLTVNQQHVAFVLQYAGAEKGWVFA